MAGTAFSTSNWSGYITHAGDITHATAGLTDFSLIIDIAELVADDVAASSDWVGAVQSDGGDIRCTDESDTEIPFDLIDWDYNGGSPTGLIRVKRSLTANTSTQKVRVWAGYTGGTAVAYDANDASGFGSDNAYDTYWELYVPDGGTTDRTANGDDFTTAASSVAGKIGSGTDYSGANNANGPAAPAFEAACATADEITILTWVNPDVISASASDEDSLFYSRSSILRFQNSDELETYFYNDAGAATLVGDSWTTDAWQHAALTFNNTTMSLYRNAGTPTTTAAYSSEGVGLSSFDSIPNIGSNSNATPTEFFDGTVNEFQIHSIARDADWVAHEYAQTDDNATFWGAWSWAAAQDPSPVVFYRYTPLQLFRCHII